MNRLTRILIELALEEDLRDRGDLTSRYFVDADCRTKACVVAREFAVVSGHEVAEAVCAAVSPELEYGIEISDGGAAGPGETVSTLSGPTRSVLTAERTALNFLQRLSGVATTTRAFADRIEHTDCRLLDTRKTTPGMRELEKAAVRHGGGVNHRNGLHDAVMVKDNHIASWKGCGEEEGGNLADRLAEKVAKVKRDWNDCRVEFEADNLDQVETFLAIEGLDVILLDNMSCEQMREAVRMRDGQAASGRRVELEASGGVSLESIGRIAETGVDFVSVGALTHSVAAVDLGLDFFAA